MAYEPEGYRTTLSGSHIADRTADQNESSYWSRTVKQC